jgi:hypothetical protein
MRFERLRGGRMLERARDDEPDEPEVPTVRAPERNARVTLRSPTATKKAPSPVPQMRRLGAPRPAPSPPRANGRANVHPEERESGIRQRPPVRELAPPAERATRRAAPISETLVCSTPQAGVPSLVLNGPTRSIVFEAPPPAPPSMPTVVIAPPPAPTTARRRPTVLALRPTAARLPFFLMLVAVAFVAFAGVRFAPALRRASAALAVR